ncbi:hypothetical protein D9758_004838 [Tetrapyrgos nigripes]|uniref:SET domain-containing protein n=1 Tax=Tetrapyrgos nigripes TaxID=182062 RepID=A0A8H5G5Y0_9AGAR|nr:hypothetical protein D9758_004838 [Tetrapyrgos nigripes]
MLAPKTIEGDNKQQSNAQSETAVPRRVLSSRKTDSPMIFLSCGYADGRGSLLTFMTARPDAEVVSFTEWLRQNHGEFDGRARFISVPSGFQVIADTEIPTDTTIVSCPFSLVITKKLAEEALLKLFNFPQAGLDSWSERQCIASYLGFHFILGEESREHLSHHPYVKMLPSHDRLRTALHFTLEERELFKGSNLYGAIIDRENEWRTEWVRCQEVISGVNEEWGQKFSWELYLASSTYISSRAFPSTLLSPNPSLQASPSAEPVLLPGVDSLNHARGKPVSWVVSYPNATTDIPEPRISLVLHTTTVPGDELFNNYGAKPNSELILGYGFSLSDNPDDTILLKVGGSGQDTRKWEVGRSGRGIEGLWLEIVSLMMQSQEPGSGPIYEDELEAASVLGDMARSLIDRLPPAKRNFDPAQIRPDVVKMYQDYIEGQHDILDAVVAFANEKERLAIERAREQGVELVIEDDESA